MSLQVDVFEIEAVDLKRIKKLCIRHDASGPGSGWYLENVVITPKNGHLVGKKFTFPCGR